MAAEGQEVLDECITLFGIARARVALAPERPRP